MPRTPSCKPMLRRVGAAALHGMTDKEVSEKGFQIALDAMRAAYISRFPDSPMARHYAGMPVVVHPDMPPGTVSIVGQNDRVDIINIDTEKP